MLTQEEKVCVSSLMMMSSVKRWLSQLHRAVLPGLFLLFGQISSYIFHTWPTLGPSSGYSYNPQLWIPLKRFIGGCGKSYYGLTSWLFHPTKVFHMHSVSFSPRVGNVWSLNLLTGFSPNLPCHKNTQCPVTCLIFCHGPCTGWKRISRYETEWEENKIYYTGRCC